MKIYNTNIVKIPSKIFSPKDANDKQNALSIVLCVVLFATKLIVAYSIFRIEFEACITTPKEHLPEKNICYYSRSVRISILTIPSSNRTVYHACLCTTN